MPTQPSLLPDDPRYEPFGGLADDYPIGAFKPLHPAFNKSGRVNSGIKFKRTFLVDLSIGECTCQRGHAWSWGDIPTKRDPEGKWYLTSYCTHKLRMMASIVEAQTKPSEKRKAEDAYLKALSTRYNSFEVVSAFHKELRRGDFDKAWFWGLILTKHRGLHGVAKYLLNIIYEETRDHDLAEHLIKLNSDRDMITLSQLATAILWFCKAKKKWELPHRLAIFRSEMLGYESLAKDFSPDVAKGAGIIPSENEAKLKLDMVEGFKKQNWTRYQRGWKGLQKMVFDDQHGSLDDYRYYLYEYLYDFAEERLPDTHAVWGVVRAVNARIAAGFAAGYHELNAIADAIAGEPYEAGLMPLGSRQRIAKRPSPGIPLIHWPSIPLYANDNHTWAGKALMRSWGAELKPGAVQEHLDFRYCGAYFGVCYRTICQAEFGSVDDIAWEQVTWPKDLYKIVMMLWY